MDLGNINKKRLSLFSYRLYVFPPAIEFCRENVKIKLNYRKPLGENILAKRKLWKIIIIMYCLVYLNFLQGTNTV